MTFDWNLSAAGPALAGGLLIGFAAAALLLLNGRIAGVSGVAGGLLKAVRGDVAWRVAFITGLVGAPLCYSGLVAAGAPWAPVTPPRVDAGVGLVLAAGFISGLGARSGGGCTSGHGVCGLSRRSTRSFVATLVFVASGMLTVFVLRHVLGN